MGIKSVNYDCHRFPIGSIGSRNVHTSGYPLVFTGSLMCGAVVAYVPSKNVYLCSDKCTFHSVLC